MKFYNNIAQVFGPAVLSFLLFCEAKRQDAQIGPKIKMLSSGVSEMSFQIFADMGGFQKIEEREILRKVFTDMNSEEIEISEDTRGFRDGDFIFKSRVISVRVKWVQNKYSYAEDKLPFIELTFSCGKSERFFGFGEWSDRADATGLKRKIWVSEQHAGRGDDTLPPLPYGEITTYFPVPFFISSQNYAFFVTGFSLVEFDMCSDENNWKVKVFSDSTEFFVFGWENSPLDAIRKFTAIVGRQRTPPIWTFGNWIDAIGGEEKVIKTAQFLREQKIPSSAIWTEDWAGGKWINEKIYFIAGWNNKHSTELYPNIKDMAQKLNAMGFKFLGYFNTFIVKGREIYEEAEKKGYTMKNRDGKIPSFFAPDGEIALLDLTNEEAQKWMKEIMKNIAQLGFAGWMADFGEWITPDMIASNGMNGWELHNLYPYLWSKLTREFWDEHLQNNEFSFFSRSGFTGSWVFSPVVWQGDQNTTFERYDGIGAIIPSMTSIGMSGVANVGPDIAGYTSGFITPPSNKELYIRWTSICAFVPVFRTHHGVTPLDNWRFDKDEETLMIFRKYATEHMRLAPYIYGLSKEAEEKGYPVVRHIFLHYPNIIKSLPDKIEVIEQEFMLGEKILVAPIVREGENEREVFIPPGRWVNYFTREKYDGGVEGRFILVKIPLGEIFVLVREGECIEIFDPVPQTLTPVSEEEKRRYNILSIEDVAVKNLCF